MIMLGRTSWMVAAFFALAGCTIDNTDHCYFQQGDEFCGNKYGGDYKCSQCTAANNGCVTDFGEDAPEDKCHAETLTDTGSTSELTNADSTVTASSSMSSTTMSSMSGDATTSPTSTTTSADTSTTSNEESSSTDPGSSSESTGVVGPMCGNDVIEGAEICDGADLGDATDCAAVMLGDGEVSCNEDCTLNLEGCSGMPMCGNDLIEGNEQCEGPDLAGDTCESLGYVAGTLVCDGLCNFDVTGCESCGNGYIDLDDNCDGNDLNGQDCTVFDFFGGDLACDASCNFDTSDCNMCGNGVIDAGEQCDGDDLGGDDCTDLGGGYSGGTLDCNANCTFDVTACCFPILHGCDVNANCCSGNCIDLVCL